MCLKLYYALSAEAFGTGEEGHGGRCRTWTTCSGGLQELYESRERDTEDWVQRNLEDLRDGTFRSPMASRAYRTRRSTCA